MIFQCTVISTFWHAFQNWWFEKPFKLSIWMNAMLYMDGTITRNLTLFRPGGGRLCPHWLWAFITFFISKLNPPNLVTFPAIYLGIIWHSNCLSIKFDVTMATTFWQAVFSSFLIFIFSLKNCNFSEVSFTFLCHFHVLLLFSVTFWSILANFKGFGKIKKSKMADPR